MTNDNDNDSLDKLLGMINQKMDQQQKRQEQFEIQNPKNYQSICEKYSKYDSWSLKEGLNLLCRCHPEKNGWDHGIKSLWTLADRSIGESLNVINPNTTALTHFGKCSKIKVRPRDLFKWAEIKNIPIPEELKNAVPGNKKLPGTPVQIATQKRTQGKSVRLNTLEQFLNEAQTRATAKGYTWDKLNIEVTKKNLMVVFYAINPEIKKVGEEQFSTDLKNIGARFKRGIKDDPDNILTVLFESELN